ncbi:DinB family protein [Glycomyces sp. A-F 0318]|uniref:DinB family protein n=1 Tax=Glycomyces amatae TaxID=2881355 RepID=UPI001E623591|nr:DinB family protein [Glycomyces amatae]MCD0443075.1 DinB family protein [Glycomyces amatae]
MKRDRARPQPPDERTALYERLRWQRQTVRKKTEGLAEDLAHRAFLPSPLMTAAGLVSHLRWVEHAWFEVDLLGLPDRGPWTDEDPDAEMRVDGVPLARLLDEYDEQCARSVEIADGMALDGLEAAPPPGREPCSLRWVLLHLIEETARHNGHLDLIRELADGVTGE